MDWIIMKFFYFGVTRSPLSTHRSVVHHLSEAGLFEFSSTFHHLSLSRVVTSFSVYLEVLPSFFFFLVNLLPPHFS